MPSATTRHQTTRHSLAWKIAWVTMACAAVAVVVAALVSFGLLRKSASDEGKRVLANDADLIATATDNTAATRAGRPRVPAAVAIALDRQQHIQIVVVDPDGTITGAAGRPLSTRPLGAKQVARLNSGSPVHATRTVDGATVYVEGRPLTSGGAVVLFQKVSNARSSEAPIWRRLVVALAIGLAVAAIAGVLLAGRLARPLKRAAAAAHRLSTGARDVRLLPEGPAEVADVAEALNGLATALSTSEGRERDFLLSVSHELRTPLTAVKGYAEALADGVVPPDAVAPTGQVMLAESARLERLVSDLLDLARLRAQDFRVDVAEIDLTELVREAGLVWAARCAREKVPFSVDTPAHPVVVRSDPTRVRQMLDGLAENALRVTPSGRPIVFAVVGRETDVALQVRDGGPGLTDDDCRVAFDRSVLYDRYRGVRKVGTGVGLALVAGLAARLGGFAHAGRSPEGGACFTILLPRAAIPLGRPAAAR